MRRFIVLVGVAIYLSVAAFGAFAAGASEEPATDSDGLEMTFWIFLNPNSTEDPRNVVLRDIVEDYNRNNEYGNHVTVESIHWSRFEAQAIQAASANNGPDIINVYSDQLRQHVAGGTVQPMTEFAVPFIDSMPDYAYSADDLRVNGEIYSLPWESRTFVHWYRDDVIDSVPAGVDDLLDRAELSQGMALGFVIGLSDGSNAASFMESFIPLIRAAGGDLFDQNGRAVFNSDAGVRTVTFVKDLVENGVMDRTALSLGVDDIVDGFKAGTIYSMNAGTQRAATIRESSLNANIVSVPMPGFEQGQPAPALVAGQTLAIGAFAQDAEMAFDFIQYFYSTEAQVRWLQANVLPARASVFEEPVIQELANFDELQRWNEYAGTGRVVFYPDDYTELAVTLVQAVQDVVYRDADASAALDEVAEWYNSKD